MGKRSDFPRRAMDEWPTPHKAVIPLLPFLAEISTYAEPCCGAGDLVDILGCYNYRCAWQSDIRLGTDALMLEARHFDRADAIITNPPWTFEVLAPLLSHFLAFKPTWLLLQADFAHNVRSYDFIDRCTHIVSIGRVKWQPGTRSVSKDNAAWYRFEADHRGGPHFYGRQAIEAVEEAA